MAAGPGAASPDNLSSHAPGALTGRRRTWAFAIVAMAFVMDLLDVTIVNVVLPSIGQALHTSAAQSAWLVAGYALSFAVLLVVGVLAFLDGHRPRVRQIGRVIVGLALMILSLKIPPKGSTGGAYPFGAKKQDERA